MIVERCRMASEADCCLPSVLCLTDEWPQGVMVTAASFVSDINQKSFVEPLVTVSYIPLSHSSDRMKLWEFMLNGGRVGFAYFPATNWLSHEVDKKAAMVHTVSSSDDLTVLFAQVPTVIHATFRETACDH